MRRNAFIVFLIAVGLTVPVSAKKAPPPLGGSCTEIFSPDDMTPVEYTGQPQTQAVFGFVDQGKSEAEVTLRGEFQCPSSLKKTTLTGEPVMALCTDLILKRSDGRHFRVAVNFDDISEFDKYEAVHLRPTQDSLFIVAHPVTDSPALESRHWLVVLNVETCEWTGVLMDFHTHSVAWPTVVQTLRLDDPRFKPEADYLETAKYKDGYFTPEMIDKDRANPERAKYVWLSDNKDFVDGKTQGTLRLQWYPADEKDCAPEKNDLVYGHSRYKDTAHIRVCNDDTKQWSWLFVADEYQEDTSTTPARITGAQLTIETPARRVMINLDSLAYTQLAKAQAPSTDAVVPSPDVSTVAAVPSGSVVPSVPVAVPISTVAAASSQPPSELDDVVMSGETQLVQLEDDATLDAILLIGLTRMASLEPVVVSTPAAPAVAVSSVPSVAVSTETVSVAPVPHPILKAEDNPVMDQLLFSAPVSSSPIVQTVGYAAAASSASATANEPISAQPPDTQDVDTSVASSSAPASF